MVNVKAKLVERRGRKATDLRFLREVLFDSPKDSKIAGQRKLIIEENILCTSN
jgi:hypothetical protein